MRPTLYHFSGAPRGWRILLGLAFKGIKADIKLLNYSEGDHFKPEFTQLNPRSTIPVLIEGEIILRDSFAILAWLDRAYPSKPLFGETHEKAAEIWQVSMECADYLREANRQLLTYAFSAEDIAPHIDSEVYKTMKAGADLMHAECRYLEKIFSDGRPFLTGDCPSAAEAVSFPEIRLLQRAVLTKNNLMAAFGFGYPPDLYPNIARWKERLNNMPEVAATVPKHWTD